MNTEGLGESWGGALADASLALASWRRAHPQATFSEIEDARDRFMQPVLMGMTADLAESGAEVAERRCPQCGGVLKRAGKRARDLVGESGQVVHLEREYRRCEACKWAGFPPR